METKRMFEGTNEWVKGRWIDKWVRCMLLMVFSGEELTVIIINTYQTTTIIITRITRIIKIIKIEIIS